MTISTTSNTAIVQGNGLTTSFDFTFPVPTASELNVYWTNAAGVTVLLAPSQYTVTGVGTANGGSIGYPISGTPIPSGTYLTIQRVLPVVQLTDLVNQSGFYPNVVENALDYLTMLIQQIAQSADLSLQVPLSASQPNLVYPGASARAGQLAGFDANGNAITYPISASVGAGNLKSEGPFVAGTDFTPGTTTTLTLSQAYGTPANVQVHFDGIYQGTDQYSLLGAQITFTSPIPVGVSKVYVVGGTTLSANIPANGSVGPLQLAPAYGPTLNRPTPVIIGQYFYDTTLGQPVWSSGLAPGDWGNAAGSTPPVGDNSGNIATTQFVNTAIYSIVAFGGKGDGVTDNTAALNAALAAATTGRAVVYFPAGVYIFNSGINYTFPNANASVMIVGDGQDITELQWPGANIGLTINYLGPCNSVHIRDMSITTGQTNTQTGIFLHQTATSIPNPANSAPSDITNVTFRGSDGYLVNHCWAKGIDAFAVSMVNITNCTFVGNSTSTAGLGVDMHGLNSGCQSVVYNYVNCVFSFVNIGVVYREWTQGVTFTSCNFTGAGIGIQAPSNPGGTDQLCCTNCQFNMANAGIQTASPLSGVQLSNNLFISQGTTSIGISMQQYSTFCIVGNVFGGNGALTGQLGIQLGTKFGPDGGIITGNSFVNLGTAISILSTATLVNVQSNSYNGNILNVNNLGTGNTIGGGSI